MKDRKCGVRKSTALTVFGELETPENRDRIPGFSSSTLKHRPRTTTVMASCDVKARLKYLHESAHLLEATSKSTSSYLMSQCNGLMADSKIDQPSATRRKVCNSCGNIMILGQTATMRLARSRCSRGKKRAQGTPEASGQDRTKTIIYCCKLCGRQTEHRLENQPPRAVRRAATSPATHAGQSTAPVGASASSAGTQRPPDANASSKKRAKTRKSSSLQAILAASKASSHKPPGSGFGMSLLDLMKQP